MGRTLARKKVAELQKRIELCNKHKKSIINYADKLKNKCLNKEITYSEYESHLDLQGKTTQEWVDYYNDYIKNCEKLINKEEKKIFINQALFAFFSLFSVFIFIFAAFYIQPALTGFAVKLFLEENLQFSDEINISFTQTETYKWKIQNPGKLSSVKISGSIENITENSKVKIYFDNLLILDSEKLSKEKIKTTNMKEITGTGFSIINNELEQEKNNLSNLSYSENLTGEASQQTSPSQEKPLLFSEANNTQNAQIIENASQIKQTILEFADICEETCDLKLLSLSEKSYALKIEISNAKLNLDRINYEIEKKAKGIIEEITKENITSQIIQNITTLQEKAIINKPVKWKAKIKAKNIEEAKKAIPKNAVIISEKTSILSTQEVSEEIFEIEYETSAPLVFEENLTEKGKIKKIVVSSPENLHYENVLAFTTINEVISLQNKNKIKIYWIENNSYIDFIASDINNNGFIDYLEWNIPRLSNQTFEISIIILNVHSYPSLHGNWTVEFETTGTADLKITATIDTNYTSEITRWSNYSEDESLYDLRFLELKCGSKILNYKWSGQNCDENECSVLISNYSCNETAKEISKVLTPERHVLKFKFGDEEAYAYNQVTLIIGNATTILCGEINSYETIYVNASGILQICPFNGTAGTGYVNISLGNNGNFTVDSGGIVNGSGAGGEGGAGAVAPAKSFQGDNGNTSTVGIASTLANGGGGSGANGSSGGSYSAGGGGGGFGGAGGWGGGSNTATTKSVGGLVYGSSSDQVLKFGSGGGGESGDLTSGTGPGAAAGGGIKVDAGAGVINMQGTINVSGLRGTDGDKTDDSGGGGGSGGHVILIAKTMNLSSGVIYASGGKGGDGISGGGGSDSCGGGGGGGGRIVYVYQTIYQTSLVNLTTAGATGAGISTTCDAATDAGNSSAGAAGTVFYNSTTTGWPDIIYPLFSSYWDNNASLVESGKALFNVTLTNTNGTVLLEINNQNITAKNLTANVYNASYDFASAGTYAYRWHSWGNGTNKNYNKSEDRSYTVNESLVYPLFNNFVSTPLNNTEYALGAIYTFNTTVTNTNGTVGLEFNGTNYTAKNLTANVYNVTLTNLRAGTFSYYWWGYGNGTTELFNKTQTYYYTVAQNSSFILTLSQLPSGTWTETYGIETTATGSGCPSGLTCNLYLNSTGEVSNPHATTLGAGSYNYTYNTTGNTNYSSKSISNILTINKASNPVALKLNGNSANLAINYPQQLNASATSSGGSVKLFRDSADVTSQNSLNVSLASGYYQFKANATGNQNYTDNSTGIIFYANITKAIPKGNLTNKTEWTITYGIAVNISYQESNTGDADAVYKIFRNNIDVANENSINVTLGVGTYNYLLNATGGQNYTDNSSIDAKTLVINQATSEINGTINGTQGNFTAVNGTANQNIYINATNKTGYGAGKIYVNGTLYNSGTLPLFNITNLSIGFYNITFVFDENANYTSDTEVLWVNITLITNQAPQITYVSSIDSTDPTEASIKTIIFNISVYDENGASNINTTSINANFTKTGEAIRQNLSCLNISSSGNYMNFSCSIDMWYFDANGIWNISVSAKDLNEAFTTNSTTTFQYNLLKAIVISPSQLTFDVNIGAENQTATNDPTTINNTGNYNATGNIAINAINLYGPNNFYIDSKNFSIDIDTGGTPPAECDGTILQNSTDITITQIILNKGNLSQGSGIAQEQIYYCLIKTPTNIQSGTYDTSTAGSWIIKILVTSLVFSPKLNRKKKKEERRRKEKAKSIENDKLVEALSLILDELKQEYSLNKKELSNIILEKIKERYNISKKEIVEIIQKEKEIPVTIFSKNLGALESLCKYLKENLNMSYHEIAKILNRNDRTIWTAYKKANEKQPKIFEIKETIMSIPLSIFKNRKLTILESIILYLKEKGIKYSEMAKLLDRDQRNIWTIYSRTVKK